MARVQFTADARQDLVKLDRSVQTKVLAKLNWLKDNPEAGRPLGRELAGFRKLTVGNRDWRIIYRATDDLVLVIAVGRRDNDEVYREVVHRVESLGPSPIRRDMRRAVEGLADIDGRPRPRGRRFRRRRR